MIQTTLEILACWGAISLLFGLAIGPCIRDFPSTP
jgi:hypothetical protein